MMCRAIGKIVDRLTSMVVVVVTFGTNGCRQWCYGIQWWQEKGSCLDVMRVELAEGGDGKVICNAPTPLGRRSYQ